MFLTQLLYNSHRCACVRATMFSDQGNYLRSVKQYPLWAEQNNITLERHSIKIKNYQKSNYRKFNYENEFFNFYNYKYKM